MVTHEQVEAGRVAAAHLEPVDRRQRDLHRMEPLECCDGRVGARERGDLTRGAQSVATDGPHRVARPHERGVDVLELGHRERGAQAVVELALQRVAPRRQLVDAVGDEEGGLRTTEERPDPGNTAQRGIDHFDRGGDLVQSPDEITPSPPTPSPAPANAMRARSSSWTRSAASGTGRVARRRTTPTIPHMR